MSQRATAKVTPFDFRSDFDTSEGLKTGQDDRISISVAELAALLEDTRQSTAALVRDEQLKLQSEALKATTEQLKSALANIVQLAETLERLDISESDRDEVTTQVCRIASEMIDGQGNLFQS
ncbi:MAG: hypothetical protein WA989_07085 [Henriciella sp.]|uniref:hypothetical protein n=1 Tax=Henriciella sp. TaxID=1968823 RepID=UPI003C718281